MRTDTSYDVHTSARPPLQRRTVYVDCVHAERQDLVSFWARAAGCDVVEGVPPATATHPAANEVFVTDRFGPGLPGEIPPADLKAARPSLRIIVLGSGDSRELAQLSLARVAGVDATLATPLQRQSLLDALGSG